MTSNRYGAVAIVDDDAAVLDSLKFLLEATGHEVACYTSAAELLDDRVTQVACFIIDQCMPQMTGLQLAACLRTEGADTPILLITASPAPHIVARAAELGIEKVLEKPLTAGDLMSFVNGSVGLRASEPRGDGQGGSE
jgi:FixJ family two-component response regulator